MTNGFGVFGGDGGYSGYGGGFGGGYGGGPQTKWDKFLAILRVGMIRGYRVGRLFRIDIYIHLLLVLLFGLSFVSQLVLLLAGRITIPMFLMGGIYFWVVLFVSVLLHELGHCYGSWIVGGRAERIILWPLGGLALTGGSNKAPSGDMLVTLLGPAVNLVIGVPLWIVLSLIPDSLILSSPIITFVHLMVRTVMVVNIGLFAFNMCVPVLPMDAGRVLRAAMSMRMDSSKATYQAATVGLWIAGAMVLMALFYPGVTIGPVTMGGVVGVIGIFGALTCWQERMFARHQRYYSSEIATGGRPSYTFTSHQWRSPTWLRGIMRLGGRGAVMAQRSAGQAKGAGARIIKISPAVTKKQRLGRAEAELREAVAAEDFARAAELREKIAAIKRGE